MRALLKALAAMALSCLCLTNRATASELSGVWSVSGGGIYAHELDLDMPDKQSLKVFRLLSKEPTAEILLVVMTTTIPCGASEVNILFKDGKAYVLKNKNNMCQYGFSLFQSSDSDKHNIASSLNATRSPPEAILFGNTRYNLPTHVWPEDMAIVLKDLNTCWGVTDCEAKDQ